MKRNLSLGLIIIFIIIMLPNIAIASSEADLINNLKNVTSDDIVQTCYDDFNSDGIYEMFALTGQDSGDAWFVSESQTKKLNNSHFNAATGETQSYVITDNGKKYFEFFEVYGNGQVNSIVCTLQTNGDVEEVKFSGYLEHNQYGWCVTNSTYDSTIEKSDFNSGNYYGMVGTWKNYWYYIDETSGTFKEYGGTEITKEQFLSFNGAEDILNLITDGQIYNILYRDNGIININIISESGMFADNDAYACSNILVGYDDNSVWTIDDQHFDAADNYRSPMYSGFYLPALNSDIAVYAEFKNNSIIEEISVYINGEKIEFDQPPIMAEGDRVMVPIRKIFETFGYTLDWDQNTRTATATNNRNKLVVVEGLCGVNLDDEQISFDVANINYSGRIFVPVRVVAECAGADVEWDGANKTVIINYDSDTAIKKISFLKYRLACQNYLPSIFKKEDFDYLNFYENMYNKKAIEGAFADWMAENFVGQELNKEKYIDVLTTLFAMSEFTISDNIQNLSENDSLKTFGDYVWDVGEIVIGTIQPEGSKKLDVIKALIDADSEAINLTIDTMEKYERLNKIKLETEFKLNMLDLIENGATDDLLVAACRDIRIAEKKRTLLELEIFSENLSSISKYLTNDVLYKQMVYPLIKQSDVYSTDSTLRAIVDKNEQVYKNVDQAIGALETGFKLGLFAGDMLFGTSNTMNRVSEIKALSQIRQALISSSEFIIYAQPLLYAEDIDKAYQEITKRIPQIKFINNMHLRGEYCLYKLLIEDMQLFSVMYLLGDNNIENLDLWWENTKSNLIWYDKKLSKICQ